MNLAILGLGTIGSFISTFLSDLDEVNEIVLVDYDRVEKKNLRNTTFRKSQIGMFKADAIQELIEESNDTVVHNIHEKFLEGETKLPISVDYIVDCRDVTYNRKNIDVRLYFSGRSLIVDCRKQIEYEMENEGVYISKLTKADVIDAANAATMLFKSRLINRFITERVVYRHELDMPKMTACNFLDERKLSDSDYVYESCIEESKLINLHENVPSIIKMNKGAETTLFVGPKDHSSFTKVIPQNSLTNLYDVIQCLTESINLPFRYPFYLVSPNRQGNECYIELIPDTGAA